MGIEEVKRIKEVFSKLKLNTTYLEHEPVITSEDAAKIRGFELKQGIKAIVLTDESNFAIADISAHQKVDQKKVASQMGWSKGKIRMANEQEVMEKTGCELGAVPPFGHKTKLQILVDKGVFDNEISAFNIGLRTHSVKIPTEEMRIVFEHEKVIEGDFVKFRTLNL